MIKVAIVNPLNGDASKIGTEGELPVVVHPHPPIEDDYIYLPFRQYFTDNGQPDGSNDMRVTGTAASPVDFYISALNEDDIFIKTIAFVISDAQATLSDFGNIGALPNGIEFCFESQSLGVIVINDQLRTNFDFIQQCAGNPSFGSGIDAFRAQNVVGNSEAYIPTLDFGGLFGTPYGVRLKGGTKDRLLFRVKDDTSGVDRFDIVAFGGKLNINAEE